MLGGGLRSPSAFLVFLQLFLRGNFMSNNKRFAKTKQKKFGGEILNDKIKQFRKLSERK